MYERKNLCTERISPARLGKDPVHLTGDGYTKLANGIMDMDEGGDCQLQWRQEGARGGERQASAHNWWQKGLDLLHRAGARKRERRPRGRSRPRRGSRQRSGDRERQRQRWLLCWRLQRQEKVDLFVPQPESRKFSLVTVK
jgi:hypothetical protein